MSYSALAEMRTSGSLRARLVACAAQEGVSDPDIWYAQHGWTLVARADWIAAWASATANYSPDYNPDTGARPGVITDGMILAAVQAVLAETKEVSE